MADADPPETDPPPIDATEPDPRQDELDGLRIRQLATARRAAYRARSYAVIAAVVCAVAAGQLLWSMRTAPLRHTVLAALALVGFAYFGRLAARLHREAKRSPTPEPTAPPDFTGLGEGSDAPWKKLEDVQ